MTKKELLEYCKVKGIFAPSAAPKSYLEAAIVKAFEHCGEKVKRASCFGYYGPDDAACTVCDLVTACSNTTLGMDPTTYRRAFKRAENPKIRIEPMTRKRR